MNVSQVSIHVYVHMNVCTCSTVMMYKVKGMHNSVHKESIEIIKYYKFIHFVTPCGTHWLKLANTKVPSYIYFINFLHHQSTKVVSLLYHFLRILHYCLLLLLF